MSNPNSNPWPVTQTILWHPNQVSLKIETHQSEDVQPAPLASPHSFDKDITLVVEVRGIKWKYEPENATREPGEGSILEADRNFR